MLKRISRITDVIKAAQPSGGKRCGDWLYIIAKVQIGLPLSIIERDLVLDALRRQWLTPKEWKAYRRQLELQQYEDAKKIAQYGVPYGQREEWVQRLYGKSKKALTQYFSRIRSTARAKQR
jgi:hypothetical protein